METINDRVKILRADLGLSMAAFADKIGYTQGTISQIEAGHVTVERRLVVVLGAVFRVREAWLLTGYGEIYHEPDPIDDATLIHVLRTKYGLDPLSVDLLRGYLALNPDSRAGFAETAMTVCNAAKVFAVTKPGVRPSPTPGTATGNPPRQARTRANHVGNPTSHTLDSPDGSPFPPATAVGLVGDRKTGKLGNPGGNSSVGEKKTGPIHAGPRKRPRKTDATDRPKLMADNNPTGGSGPRPQTFAEIPGVSADSASGRVLGPEPTATDGPDGSYSTDTGAEDSAGDDLGGSGKTSAEAA